jgi:hypothetical protein
MLAQGVHPKIVSERLGHRHDRHHPGHLLARLAQSSARGGAGAGRLSGGASSR